MELAVGSIVTGKVTKMCIRDRLEGNYQVYPGHEQPTNLDFERRFNPYMQQGMAQ